MGREAMAKEYSSGSSQVRPAPLLLCPLLFFSYGIMKEPWNFPFIWQLRLKAMEVLMSTVLCVGSIQVRIGTESQLQSPMLCDLTQVN